MLYEGVRYHSYADDISLYVFADPRSTESVNHALSSLSSCVEYLQMKWMACNMLKLNCDKTEFLVVSTPHARQYVSDVKLLISGLSINPTFAAKSLGVEFDSALKMDRHVSTLCRGLHYHLSNIARIRPFIDAKACEHAV